MSLPTDLRTLSAETQRSQFLQLMRFVAAALVLGTHTTFYYHERVNADIAVWHFGEVGVPIFFVISGIVMVLSAQSLSRDANGAREFILKRIIRIVPLWWLALSIKVALALAWPSIVNHNHFQLDHAVKSYLFIPYFNEAGVVLPMHGVGWTLLHEAFFYVTFTLALLCRLRPALWVSLTIIGFWAAGRIWVIDSPFWAVASSAANLQFILGMVVGVLLLKTPAAPGSRKTLAAVFLGLALAAALFTLTPERPELVAVLFAFAAATLVFVHCDLPPAWHWLARLGDSSYSLYLFHPFIAPAAILMLAKLMPQLHFGLVLVVTLVVTTVISHALHLLFERPLVRAAQGWLTGRQPAPLKSVQQNV